MSVMQHTSVERLVALISNVEIRRWGSALAIDCFDDPINRHRYHVMFRNCRELHWSHDAMAAMTDTEADVIGLTLGQGEYGEPAILTTDLFDLSVLSDRMDVEEFPRAKG